MDSEMAADLAQFDNLYESADAGGSESMESEVPDGEYAVIIEQVDLTRARSGNNMLVFRMRISDGIHAGRVVRKNRAITEKTIPYLKEELVKCGLNLERLSELPRHIPALAGKSIRIAKRTISDNVNVYIQWSQPRSSRGAQALDDLPF